MKVLPGRSPNLFALIWWTVCSPWCLFNLFVFTGSLDCVLNAGYFSGSLCCGRGFASGARVTRHLTESPAQLSTKTLVICCRAGMKSPVVWGLFFLVMKYESHHQPVTIQWNVNRVLLPLLIYLDSPFQKQKDQPSPNISPNI